MEVALSAHLDRVTLHGLLATLELGQFGARRRAGAAGRETRAEDVGHLDQLRVAAHRTALTRGASNVARRAQQLGVRVTDVFVEEFARGHLGQQCSAHEAELDDGPVGAAGSQAVLH